MALSRKIISSAILTTLLSSSAFALSAPEPLSCMQVEFNAGTQWPDPWKATSLTLTNHCNKDIDLRDAELKIIGNTSYASAYILSPTFDIAWPATTNTVTQLGDNKVTTFKFDQFQEGNQWWQPKTIMPVNAQLIWSSNPVKGENIISSAFYPHGDTPIEQKGQMHFSIAEGSDPLPANTKITITGKDTGYITTIDFATTATVKDIPYGEYSLSASAVVDGKILEITMIPSLVSLSKEQPQASAQVSYKNQSAELIVTLHRAKPTDVTHDSVTLNLLNKQTQNISHQETSWNDKSTFVLDKNTDYVLSADPMTGSLSKYSFTFDGKSEADINMSQGRKTIQMSYTEVRIPTGTAEVSATGLDGHSATVYFTGDDKETHDLEIPKDTTISLAANQSYNVTANTFTVDGYRYSLDNPQTIAISENKTTDVALAFNKSPIPTTKQFITGYWENWKGALRPQGSTNTSDPAYYSNDIKPYTHVLYSFLTLAKSPNPDNPQAAYWDGQAIYESMTQANVIDVMTTTDPAWQNPYNWQKLKIDALITAVHNNNGKFIWAIGGWSDLTKTIKPEQIDTFVNKVVELLKLSGDGVDFDWEHLSQDQAITEQQLKTLAETLLKLRQALDKAGMHDKQIGYTTRFNAFMQNASEYGFSHYQSDGEGLAINNWLKAHGSSLNAVVDWVNIMAYDVDPNDMPNGQTWSMEVYKHVFDTFAQHVDPSKIVMGFEPGGQAAGGVWEGMTVDKSVIDYIATIPYGGSMFWAINQPAYNSSEVTGDNAYELANYSQQKFGY
ncbi:hypothetical protein [Cysteiniphilum sp. QT6929]|uniref:hypothetical protein n=1 Tax=Cysteiniphilum sp. QT6929 TaxID=2975055 RepID=UPI0024B3B63E|nr:hypothetical protein [Cysteiniphilum sp. QT6929]WHN64766.1 hypothetical protein NYP54_06810 [Cysteiniphilum sp. QT6929]